MMMMMMMMVMVMMMISHICSHPDYIIHQCSSAKSPLFTIFVWLKPFNSLYTLRLHPTYFFMDSYVVGYSSILMAESLNVHFFQWGH